MSNDDEKFPKKKFCYKDDCKPVITGFHVHQFFSCSMCKLELSESLYKQIKDRQKSLEDIQKEIDKLWDI